MKLESLYIKNYKSLRDVTFSPEGLSVLIGANASGKTNFADAVDFLANVYRSGLEIAVSSKGGYENIAYRKKRRTKTPIEFGIEVTIPAKEARKFHRLLYNRSGNRTTGLAPFRIKHEFSFIALSSGIRTEYEIVKEKLTVSTLHERSTKKTSVYKPVTWVHRFNERVNIGSSKDDRATDLMMKALDHYKEYYNRTTFDEPQNLVFTNPSFLSTLFREILILLSNMAVFRFSPDMARMEGVSTTNPMLSYNGNNLPALVYWLQDRHEKKWEIVLNAMREVVPELEDILVDDTHAKTLGLFFKEEHVGQPWTSADVSDGTIQTLAMFVAALDPRTSLLLIEEPENSVHPWIIKSLLERFRALSKNKPVIITTHSPTLIDTIYPSEAWIVYKEAGETSLKKLTSFEPSLQEDWEQGKYSLSEYLDSGLVPKAVPGGNI